MRGQQSGRGRNQDGIGVHTGRGGIGSQQSGRWYQHGGKSGRSGMVQNGHSRTD